MNKIQVYWLSDGKMPIGTRLATIHEHRRGPGWYCVTPDRVAHGPYPPKDAFWLVRQWLHNFRNDAQFWFGGGSGDTSTQEGQQ